MWWLNDIKYSVRYPELRSRWGNEDGSSGESDDGVWIVVILAVVVIAEVIDGDDGGDGDNEGILVLPIFL